MTLLCFTWALQQISLKAVSDQISPMLMVALRSLVAAVLLGGLMAWRRERLDRSRWGAGAAVGSLFALEFLLVAEALRLTAAAHVVVFLYTAPLFAVLGLHLLRPEERLARRQWIGVALAFGGTALAFLGGHEGQMVHEGQGAPAGQTPASAAWLGDALALLAGMAWGATTITIRTTRLTQAPATETLLYQLVGAVVWLLPVVGLTGQWQFEPTPRVWVHLGFHSVVVSFVSFLTWFWLMRRYLASRLGVFSFLTPLLGVVLGIWLLGESLAPTFVMGSVLVLAGIVLASRPGGRSRS
ncbi:DMT family transporter [Roseateles sp. SL47]|uniref:DMT family transporter n=1 Tax=Roseateles sp. SL47 TaxID=2995138 RepID=UPI00226F9B1A|nr:DMT family transporter [Roseateles sp. SL47]WAC75775.1 DMT family transporter [Roseateles sp. SL47]